LLDFLEHRGGDLLALRHDGLAGFARDRVRQLESQQAIGNVPEQLLILDRNLADLEERPQDLRVRLQAKSAQKNRAVEFALAVDTNIQEVLVVVFELDPASAIRNDLAEKITLRR